MFGNKANNLIKLQTLGYNVPEFICLSGYEVKDIVDNNLIDNLIIRIRTEIGNYLVSIRSSPVKSMPGMMDTILNFDFNNKDELLKTLSIVYNSYYTPRAILYRKINNIEEHPPGIIIQRMVFGNKDKNSGSGVFFTRDNFGKTNPVIEYYRESQGIQIVDNSLNHDLLCEIDLEIKDKIVLLSQQLEKDFIYPQDVEFTIESGVLYILQTRNFKINNLIDIELLKELLSSGKITKEDFTNKIEEFNDEIYQLTTEPEILYLGKAIVPGIVVGKLGEDILLKDKVYNDDLELIHSYKGLITKEGSLTDHVSNICRILNKPYIVIDSELNYNDVVILDGTMGRVYKYEPSFIKIINKEQICAALADF
jgi:pyruvate,orthophosphate dikinase